MGNIQQKLINFIHPVTHILAGLIIFMLWRQLTHPSADWLALGLIWVGTILPDIDTNASIIGRLIPPLSRYLEQRFGHRQEIHTIWPPLALFGLARLIPPTADYLTPLALGGLSHLLLDTLNAQGIAPFLPLTSHRLILMGGLVQRQQTSERILLIVLILAALGTAVFTQFEPSEFIQHIIPTTNTAREQYRAWEGRYRVYADVHATFNATHVRYRSQFEVMGLDPHGDLILRDLATDRTYTASNQPNSQLYLSRIVVRKGEPITSSIPLPSPTPQTVIIRIEHIYNPNIEILIRPGDEITPGQLIADLSIHRSLIVAPTHTPIPPTATPTPRPTDALTRPLADAQVTSARAELAQARNRLKAAQDRLSFLESFVANGWDNVDWNEVAYWIEGAANGPKGKRLDIPLHRALDAAQLNVNQTQLDITSANASLAAALARQKQAHATPTPTVTAIPPTVTPTPSLTPVVSLPDPTWIRSLLRGRVVSIRVIAVAGNQATVEILVEPK